MENENLENKFSHINGWGIDADPENEPTYPMKKYTGDDHQRIHYEKPSQQPVNVEILHSIERPGVSAVFGTSTPPKGWSGAIRRYAFKYSESSYGHWLPLMLADRVDVVEGIIEDLKKGIVPNIFAERGWTWEWKNDPKRLVKKVAIGVAVASALILIMNRKNKR